MSDKFEVDLIGEGSIGKIYRVTSEGSVGEGKIIVEGVDPGQWSINTCGKTCVVITEDTLYDLVRRYEEH